VRIHVRRNRQEEKEELKMRKFESKLLHQISMNPSETSTVDPQQLVLTDPTKISQKAQVSIAYFGFDRNPIKNTVLGKTSKSKPIHKGFERGLKQ
jgi:hypothetical protein